MKGWGDNKMKRILLLNYEFPPLGGGAANATYYLLREFSHYPELKIDLVTSSTDKFHIENFSNQITIHYLDIGKNENIHYQSNRDLLKYSYKAYQYCLKLKQKNKFDLIHAFFGIPCGYIAMKLKIPYIVSLRGSDVPFYNKRFYWLDKFIFQHLSKKIWRKANAVVANSQGLKNLALESAPKQKIDVIYNGVDTNEFAPIENKPKNDKLILISTGRLIARKGYNFLIEAIANLLQVELWLIGEGNLKNELELQAKTLNAQIKFLGKKEHHEIPKYLKQADIFVLPSLNEGMSNSILEAMACGLPIIATDTGGSAELIQGNGIIVEKSNVQDLKNAINHYINQPTLLMQHADKSLELAKKMNWSSIAQEYVKQKYYEI